MNPSSLRLALVGPLPPPSGGMANQTRQLAELLEVEGAVVEIVQTNAAYRPAWIGHLRGIRALFRLAPYVWALWRGIGRSNIVHVMANSGWSWHLTACPAIWVAWIRRVPVVLNYRGGGAKRFFDASWKSVRRTLQRATAVVVPSRFLERVFGEFGFSVRVVPNIVDLGRFVPRRLRQGWEIAPHIVVARNLELIYDIRSALASFRIVRDAVPGAHLTIAGSGPEHAALLSEATQLGCADAVKFTGRLDNFAMRELYREADLMLNPSLVDNMPISILEALASGLPVVTTDAGGIPDMVENGCSAVVVPAGDSVAMARGLLSLIRNPVRAEKIAEAGLAHVQQFGWPHVREQWLRVYEECIRLRSVAKTRLSVHGDGMGSKAP